VAASIQTKATPVFIFDTATHRYLSASGKPLSQAELRGFIDKAVTSARAEARAIAEAFLEHGNSAELITSLKDLIRNENLAMSMIANGGRDQMTASLYGKSGAIIKDQYFYADRLGREIDNGDLTNFGEGFLNRVSSYANQGLLTYEGFTRDGMIEAGMSEAQNISGSENGCDECDELSDAGWIDASEMPAPGERICQQNCRCNVEYR